jgi:type II secretory pathway pseudopilin PulG
MKRSRIILPILALVVILAAAAFILLSRAPATSTALTSEQACVTAGQACLQFPVVTGENLPGESFTLPADFQGTQTLVILPFDEDQQVKAETWLPLARELAEANPTLAYYNVPVFPDLNAPIRVLIRGGLNLAIADESLRALTITLFLANRDQFLTELNIPNTDTIQALLLNDAGEVLWRGSGEYDPDQGAALRAAVTGS